MGKHIFILLVVLFSASCKPYREISNVLNVRDSVVFREVKKEVIVPGYSLEGVRFNMDSLSKVLASGVPRETVQKTLIREDPKTKARVKVLIDELGNLTALCEQQDQVITFLMNERDYYKTTFEKVILEEKNNIFDMFRDWVKYVLFTIGVIVIGYVVSNLIIRKRKG